MNRTSLAELRTHIESLASTTGEYSLRCCRFGDRPVPAAGLRFETRSIARAAAGATEQYRAELRRYDPSLPRYDIVVCQETEAATGDRAIEDGPAPGPAGRAADSGLVEFSHRVAAAVFETLSQEEYAAVESAVMDAYFELAASVSDPDELCLRLLERLSLHLAHLDPTQQAAVLFGAADRLDPLSDRGEPLRATLERLGRRGLVGEYDVSSPTVDSAGERTVTVDLPEYALSPHNGRLPVVPLVVTLARHGPERPPSSIRAAETDGGWRLTLGFAAAAEPVGLASAPISRPG